MNNAGDDIYTWSGGSAFVVPKGANMTKNLWEFMKFYAGTPGQNLIMPMLGDLPTNIQTIVDGNYNEKAELFRQMLPYLTSRPPLPVGSAAWATLARTRTAVALGSMTPQEAIETNQAMVEPKMALFEGYQMPDTYGQMSEIPQA